MKRAVVVYRSRTGTTRRFAEEIAALLRRAQVETQVASVGEADFGMLQQADMVFLGSWTSGLFVVAQHPDEPWVAFVRDMPPLAARPAGEAGSESARAPRIALFTTYRFVTGSMFARMRAHLAGKTGPVELELKSRDGRLSAGQCRAIERFLAAGA